MVSPNLVDVKMSEGKKRKIKKVVLDAKDKPLDPLAEMHGNLKVKKHKPASERMKKLYGSGPKKKED